MRRVHRSLGLSGVLVTGLLSTHAFAGEPGDTDAHNTEEPKGAEQPVPVIEPTAATGTPSAAAIAPASATIAPPAGPKFGDLSTSGYFRGTFGASNQKGRMTCFQLALPGNLHAKYRLGNECEVWSETHFSVVTYVGNDGSVATLHFMPTVFIPSTDIGYPPTDVVNSPLEFTTSTDATLSFPNLYADIKGIP